MDFLWTSRPTQKFTDDGMGLVSCRLRLTAACGAGVASHAMLIHAPRGRPALPSCLSETAPNRRWHLSIWRDIPRSVIIDAVIRSFADRATEDLFLGLDSRRARQACPQALWPVVRRKLDQLNRVKGPPELSIPPGNRMESLRGDRKGQHSIRVNDQYRICFRWEESDAYEVEVTDYH